jgi:hypothetical protein
LANFALTVFYEVRTHLLTVAIMFADGPLVVLIRRNVRVRKFRSALHALLVHP